MRIPETIASHLQWDILASRVLAGHALTVEEGLSILASPDLELPALLAATYRVRHRYWGNEVQLYSLRNAKSGLCPEDCGYCSQSKISSADIPKYRFNDAAEKRGRSSLFWLSWLGVFLPRSSARTQGPIQTQPSGNPLLPNG